MGNRGGQEVWLEIISGERRGAASLARGGLWCLSVLYRGGMAVRRLYYRLAAVRVDLPVVSVGNLTVGGTGKTPLVVLVARRLAAMGHRPLVVSRGYKRAGTGPGDEAAAIRRHLPPEAAHVESPDRVAAIRSAVENKSGDVAVLDDGFQHLRLRRDLDIVTIDATRPFGSTGLTTGGCGHLLPRGLLREPVSALRRAHVVVITRSDQASAEDVARIEARVRKHLPPTGLLLHAVHVPTALVTMDGRSESPDVLNGADVFAFCGLANPAAFYRTLADLGARVVAARDYPDHHAYDEADVADIIEASRAAGGGAALRIVTTSKDFVKVASGHLAAAWPADVQPAALEVEMRLREGEAALDDVLRRAVAGTP